MNWRELTKRSLLIWGTILVFTWKAWVTTKPWFNVVSFRTELWRCLELLIKTEQISFFCATNKVYRNMWLTNNKAFLIMKCGLYEWLPIFLNMNKVALIHLSWFWPNIVRNNRTQVGNNVSWTSHLSVLRLSKNLYDFAVKCEFKHFNLIGLHSLLTDT